jgi:hypothetical protein
MPGDDSDGPVPSKARAAGAKLLTFESWVTRLA